MRRHKAFNSEGELKDYLASMPPAHAYHSAAYYQYPQAPTMLEKKWQGADLIFDLDADHLPGRQRYVVYGNAGEREEGDHPAHRRVPDR